MGKTVIARVFDCSLGQQNNPLRSRTVSTKLDQQLVGFLSTQITAKRNVADARHCASVQVFTSTFSFFFDVVFIVHQRSLGHFLKMKSRRPWASDRAFLPGSVTRSVRHLSFTAVIPVTKPEVTRAAKYGNRVVEM